MRDYAEREIAVRERAIPTRDVPPPGSGTRRFMARGEALRRKALADREGPALDPGAPAARRAARAASVEHDGGARRERRSRRHRRPLGAPHLVGDRP
ncbi:MAG: hypothetical protein WDO24_18365 [Pseudomonadota bacterium]